jgi:hypothetical protein
MVRHAHPQAPAPQAPSPGEQGARAGHTPPARPDAAQRFRNRTYRYRHQLQPWRVPLLAVPAEVLHLVPLPTLWCTLGVLAIGALVGFHQWVNRRPASRPYATICVTAGTLWVLYVTSFGLMGGAGRFSFLLFLGWWLPLAYLWWDHHRIRIHKQDDTGTLDAFAARWATDVEPVLNWPIDRPQRVAAGTTYRLQLVPGQTIEDAEQAKRKVASLLRISRSRLEFEPMPGEVPGQTDDESIVRLLVLAQQNPQHENQVWQGPSLDRTTGLYAHGVYPDGPALARLYRVDGGRPHRAVNSLFTGTTGAGKSRGNAIKIAEHHMSGMFVVWYGDGKDGASAPELEQHVDWYADSHDETTRMLRAAWKVMKVRAKTIKRLHQAAFRGENVIFLGDRGFPFLQIILDEAQEFLSSPIVARLVKALLRMGNECGIGMDLLTQVPLLSELGSQSGDGGAEVIRAMAKSGNVVVYKAGDGFTGRVTIADGADVDPKQLPNLPGACYLAGHTVRTAWCRTYYVSKADLYEWLQQADPVELDQASARAAGEDYLTRHQRAKDADITPEDIDVADLDAELAILLGERLPGQDAPGTAMDKLTVKQAVFEAIKSKGPIRRDDITAALAAMNLNPSKSTIDQALAWWCDRDHVIRTGRGVYDLAHREGSEETDREPVGAGQT